MGRIGEVGDLGGVGAFLATPAAAYITGQSIVVDGGATSGSPFA
jgi:NAD(P)-dependent dehydrogenase (short-subunit alcohol dehydrogenase family)